MCIITELYGGLGNQMFQYAAGRALSHRLQVSLKLDLSKFKDYSLRSYKLNHFDIQEDLARSEDLKTYTIPENGWPLFFFRVRNFFLPRHSKQIFIQKETGYDEDFDHINRSCWLKGYWQSERYFKDIEEIIRKEFKLKEKPGQSNRELLKEIEKLSSVSVHVRRGDYVEDSVTNEVHGFLGKEYYDRAIKHFESRLESPAFFVFSDDIEWARKNISAQNPLIFVDHNGKEKDYEDLRLMWNCKHHIIANSSFSWWGAWLSNHKEQNVIAPKNWFTPKIMQKKGDIEIVPDRWITL